MSEYHMLLFFLFFLFYHSVLRITLDSLTVENKCLDKYNVRLCCVLGCFEAVVFLLCFSAQPGRCVLLLALGAIWLFVWLRCYLWRLSLRIH